MNKKWKTYIAVIIDNKLKFVTSTKGTMAYWEDGEEAQEFNITIAKEDVECLRLNGYNAFVVQYPANVELRNRKEN